MVRASAFQSGWPPRKNWCKARGGAFESAPGPPFSLIIAPVVAARAEYINLRRRQMTASTFCVCTVRKGARRATPCVLRLISAFIQICWRPIATMATHLQLVRPAKKSDAARLRPLSLYSQAKKPFTPLKNIKPFELNIKKKLQSNTQKL
jgi:hypothetical protein